MIYTVTLNPSLDYVMHPNTLTPHLVNRSTKEAFYPGGKGINVSIVLNNLGVQNKALGFTAGFTGIEIERMLSEMGTSCQFIRLSSGNSRINVKLQAEDEVEINAAGPVISQNDLTKLYDTLNEIKSGDFLVLAGSIPSYVPDTIYEDIMHLLINKQVHMIVDTTKQLLMNTLKYKPFLIKPNHIELAELFNVTLETHEDIVTYARKLQEKGAQNVLVSMGKDGAILLTHNGDLFKTPAPKGSVINTVGSGDSMIAGFIANYLKSSDYEKALKYATATGSATALSSWLATKEKVTELLLQL